MERRGDEEGALLPFLTDNEANLLTRGMKGRISDQKGGEEKQFSDVDGQRLRDN